MRYADSCWQTTFSQILDMTGRIEIGLKLDGVSREPDLWRGRTEATFQDEGKVLEDTEEFTR